VSERSGGVVTATFIGAEVAVQPVGEVTRTTYAPGAWTTIDCDVLPFDQRYVSPGGAVRFTVPPWQKVVGPSAVIVAGGSGFTTTSTGIDSFEQLLVFVTTTP
jgi:hypothetical protein